MDNINIDDDLQKKIESTKFVFMVAQSGVGKTFNGDYLQAIRGWKHIDGDIPVKESGTNSEYMAAMGQLFGDYKNKMIQGEEWVDTGAWKPYMKILARLTLEGARDSDTVVLTHPSYIRPQRAGLRQYLIDAGATDVSTVFLHCDFGVHMQAVWKRAVRQAEQAGVTVEEFQLKLIGIPGIKDFDSFVGAQKAFMASYDEPDESEQPYTMVDITAKDVTVLDRMDEAFGIEKDTSRGDETYDEMVETIKAIDVKRDQGMIESQEETKVASD